MNNQSNVVPFSRLVPKQTQAQSDAQRRAAILSSPEAQGAMEACARYLTDETALTVTEAIAVLAVGVGTYDKAQADALTATVAKRRLQERCVEILTSPAASHHINLAKWLTLETNVAAPIAIEVMVRTHADEASANV
jgi:hypothetical protein